jgi:DNA-directed RNA polymerase subunit RPC12/RpoP
MAERTVPMRDMPLSAKIWLTIAALCLLALVLYYPITGKPFHWWDLKRLWVNLALFVGLFAALMLADRLGLFPGSFPRKCPKCGHKLRNFSKDYSTGEITCHNCGATFLVRKGKVVKE